ncbi:MAG: glycosyltransferase family 4 protein, partial [Candidatus Desulforudis sp.]|nr:glycosyltransferase family 4 protein [Desulforudis sp.]
RAQVMAQPDPTLADRVIAVADSLRAELVALGVAPPERVVTVHNGVTFRDSMSRGSPEAFRRELGLSADRPVVGTVARLAPQKGVEYLLRAGAELAGAGRPVHLVIVGDGPLREMLTREAISLGADVLFLGHRPDAAALMAAFDLFALPSVTEGLPLALLEAMAGGCPVVATRVGGVPEAVVDGTTGWLVPPADPAALAAAVAAALDDPVRRAELAAAGRERVRQVFTDARMVEKTLAVYREALEARGFGELGIVF